MPAAKVEFLEEALNEILAAEEWYGTRSVAVDAAIDAALSTVRDHPLAGHEYLFGTRRHLLRKYPYGLVYLVEGDTIVIVALAHLKRRPGYWKRRVGPAE